MKSGLNCSNKPESGKGVGFDWKPDIAKNILKVALIFVGKGVRPALAGILRLAGSRVYSRGYVNSKKIVGADEMRETRESLLEALLGIVRPQILPFISSFLQVKELVGLADVVSTGENQLHHVIRMVELAATLSDKVYATLGFTREQLVTAVLFHDLGKGHEIDDRRFTPSLIVKTRVPDVVRPYPGMKWADWKSPLHDHVAKSVELCHCYNLDPEVSEAVALHHHVKIRPRTLDVIANDLSLSLFVKMDIFYHNPEQYAAPGSKLSQAVAVLDQLCAIERKFPARVTLSQEPQQIEEEVVRDLVIGIAGVEDNRLRFLNISLDGSEPVILFNLCAFGRFVKLHTEYEIQNIKYSILQLIRSLLQTESPQDERSLVTLVEADAYAVITRNYNNEDKNLEDLILKISQEVKSHTGFELRSGYGFGDTIAENFHQARIQAEMNKKCRFLLETPVSKSSFASQ